MGGVFYLADQAGQTRFAPLFLDMSIIAKLVSMMLQLAMTLTIGLGLVSLFDRSGVARRGLAAITVAAPLVGGLAALYDGLQVLSSLAGAGGPVPSQAWAPQAAQGLIPLAMGLVAATLAALFLLKKPISAAGAATQRVS